jgi:glycerol-3-phosphate acyltransferase PlsY
MISLLAIIILSYLIGSIPTSIIVGKITHGIDIRDHGSRNAGGTNAFRVLGWKAGLFVSLVDVGKGLFATVIIASLAINSTSIEYTLVQILAGLFAVFGHTWTVFAGFKGGKGVGTAAGMLIGLFPVAFFLCLIVFALVLFSTGYVSLSSITAAISLPVILIVLNITLNLYVPLSLMIFSILIPFFIIYTHRSNIQRLFAGTENRFEKLRILKKIR